MPIVILIKEDINEVSIVLYLMIIQVNMAELMVIVPQEKEDIVDKEDHQYQSLNFMQVVEQQVDLDQDLTHHSQMITKDINSLFLYVPNMPLQVDPKIHFQL